MRSVLSSLVLLAIVAGFTSACTRAGGVGAPPDNSSAASAKAPRPEAPASFPQAGAGGAGGGGGGGGGGGM